MSHWKCFLGPHWPILGLQSCCHVYLIKRLKNMCAFNIEFTYNNVNMKNKKNPSVDFKCDSSAFFPPRCDHPVIITTAVIIVLCLLFLILLLPLLHLCPLLLFLILHPFYLLFLLFFSLPSPPLPPLPSPPPFPRLPPSPSPVTASFFPSSSSNDSTVQTICRFIDGWEQFNLQSVWRNHIKLSTS